MDFNLTITIRTYKKHVLPLFSISCIIRLHLFCNILIASKNRIFGGNAPTDSIVTVIRKKKTFICLYFKIINNHFKNKLTNKMIRHS